MVWSVAAARHSRETRASDELSEAGFESYCPMARVFVVSRGRKFEKVRPLIPGYVFFVPDRDWERAYKARSVAGVFTCNGHPSPMRDEEILRLKSREGSDGYVDMNRPRYRKGQLVRTSSERHLFAGFLGTVDEGVRHGDVKVLFDIFGRKTLTTMGECELTVA